MLVESHLGHLRFCWVVVSEWLAPLPPLEEFDEVTPLVAAGDAALEAVKIGVVGGGQAGEEEGEGKGMEIFLSPITLLFGAPPPDPSSSWIISMPFSGDPFPYLCIFPSFFFVYF